MRFKNILCMLLASSMSTLAWAGNNISMVVGTYTGSGSQGIYSFSFDQETGIATKQANLMLTNPSYLTISKNGKFIYAVSEVGNTNATLSAISFNKKTGKMILLNSEPTHGEDPCYVELGNGFALTANYSGGTMSYFPLLLNGEVGPNYALFKGTKNVTDLGRQHLPHIHCTKIAYDGYIFVTDFSGDKILAYSFDKTKKKIVPQGIAAKIEEHSGPRHLIFSKNGAHAYLINELSGKVTAFNYVNGKLGFLQSIVSDEAHAKGAADIHLSPDGQFLYTSNRLKNDGITIFRVAANGRLTRIGYQQTGIHPRNFAITPNGKFLLVACRDSNKIQVFRRDATTGLLENTQQDIELSKPACIKFVPASE